MKKCLISTLLSLVSFIGFSQNQNGGQFNENNSVRLQYMGYNSSTHTFKIVNKQNCEVILRTRVDQESPIDMPTLPKDSFYVNVPRVNPGNVKFRVKTETACSQNIDMGWIELNTSGFALPLVEDNKVTFIRGENKYSVEILGYILKSDFGQLSEKQTVVIHNMVGKTLEFRRIFVNRRNQVDLYPFMVKGLNLITVFIDNKTKDIFTFKIFKY